MLFGCPKGLCTALRVSDSPVVAAAVVGRSIDRWREKERRISLVFSAYEWLAVRTRLSRLSAEIGGFVDSRFNGLPGLPWCSVPFFLSLSFFLSFFFIHSHMHSTCHFLFPHSSRTHTHSDGTTKRCRILGGNPQETFDVVRENDDLVVIQSNNGVMFTGDFPHAGVRNVVVSTPEDRLMMRLNAKIQQALNEHPPDDLSAQAAAVVHVLQNTPGLMNICRLHCSTKMLTGNLKIPNNTVGFSGCTPNAPDTRCMDNENEAVTSTILLDDDDSDSDDDDLFSQAKSNRESSSEGKDDDDDEEEEFDEDDDDDDEYTISNEDDMDDEEGYQFDGTEPSYKSVRTSDRNRIDTGFLKSMHDEDSIPTLCESPHSFMSGSTAASSTAMQHQHHQHQRRS